MTENKPYPYKSNGPYTRETLFERYNIKETHKEWNHAIDNWLGVEIFRLMHDGRLPGAGDNDMTYILNFLDNSHFTLGAFWSEIVETREDWGGLYLTAKRCVARHAALIIESDRKYYHGD